MKTILIIASIVLFAANSAVAQSKIEKKDIHVSGNCAMCKERIEGVLDRPGIKTAEWNSKTKNLEVVYNSRKISETEIHELIAGVGHDTDSVKAKTKTYAELPFCCLYRDHDHSNIVDEPHK